MTSLSAIIYRAGKQLSRMPFMTAGTGCMKYPNLQPAATSARATKVKTMSAVGLRAQVSHANKCVLLYWPPRLWVIQHSCDRGRVLLFCYSMRHADDASGYTSLAYTLLLCGDLEMLPLNSSCVGTHPKKILQNLAKLAHANCGLMSTGLIFIHWEAWGRCCQKRCGQKDHFCRAEKLKVWWN